MCGIAAILAFEDKSILNKSTLENMTKEINHRGPDDEGFYFNRWVGFGFKRLSILDLSYDGHQPMFDESKNFVIVFNGEIYNYKILREELRKKNYNFKSNTDTEVLLNAYIEWGESCFNKLEGMFAFMIYDKINEEVIAARDHIGIKPLYYLKKDNYYLFSSEIKSFSSVTKFELNEKHLYEQFVFGYVSGEDTIFKNIYRVKPGCFLKFKQEGFVCEKRFYNVVNSLLDNPQGEFSLEEIKNKIQESIKNHTVSDVGFNVQLSGGIDSSYITAVLSKEFNQTLNTYSVKLESSRNDESEYQEIVSEKFNTVHHGFLMKSCDLRDSYEKATWHHDLPLVHSGSPFLMFICKHSQSNSKVILTGEGSDELFGGYSAFNSFNLYKFQLFDLFRRYKFLNLLPNIKKLQEIKESFRIYELGIDESAVYFPKTKILSLFSQLNKNIEYREEAIKNLNQVPNKLFAAFQTNVISYLLERQDKMSMAMSVEARVPYCNYLLFDFINNLSFKKKLKPVSKAILKKLAEQYFDKPFIYRKKNGLSLPLASWLKDSKGLKPWFDLLTDKTFNERGFYNTNNIHSLIDKHLLGRKDNSRLLMNIINFEIWHRIFIDNYKSLV